MSGRTIHKFVIDLLHRQSEIVVPLGEYHKIVLVDLDPTTGDPAVWIEHYADHAGTKCEHRFFIVGTGHDIPKAGEHVGSVVQGAFVWHVYRARP